MILSGFLEIEDSAYCRFTSFRYWLDLLPGLPETGGQPLDCAIPRSVCFAILLSGTLSRSGMGWNEGAGHFGFVPVEPGKLGFFGRTMARQTEGLRLLLSFTETTSPALSWNEGMLTTSPFTSMCL